MIADITSPLKRVAAFYDGSFFWRVSQYYKYIHRKQSFVDLSGLQTYMRSRVAAFETNKNESLCQIVESHFFRGRFSLHAAKAAGSLERDRLQDQILMNAGVVAHYYPMNENVAPPEETGIDVWLALEAYDLAVHKRFLVMVLFAGDQDYVPLIRKVNGLGTRVLVLGIDVKWKDPQSKKDRFLATSSRLMDEASYKVMLSEEVDSPALKSDRTIAGIFEH